MSVLIITERQDVHGEALIWALNRLGVKCDRWSLSDCPQNQLSSLYISAAECPPVFDIPALSSQTYTSIWARKLTGPNSISEELDQADVDMALLQAERFSEALRLLISPEATWINPLETRLPANVKPRQLIAARDVGFRIPETLLSNDPRAIKHFFRAHNGNIIYKAFTPAFWKAQATDQVSCLFTSRVTEDLLDSDVALTSCPGIYQNYIPKCADLRITFFGQTYRGVRIHSQSVKSGMVDFRSDMKFESPHEVFPIEGGLLTKCIALSSKLGLLHGSYDFVEGANGEVTFLEVNEMGQFLWLEELIPDLPLLDIFAAFSLDPRPDFMYEPNVERASFRNFLATPKYAACRREFTAPDSRPPFQWLE
jgi:hypothetical protein